ncbi:MAG: D-cysteine desulfhydrase family protein [Pseudomonadales bacterium]
MLTYPDRLELAQLPTPLQRLDRLSAKLGGPSIWVKRDDLTGCVESGNKLRKLEFVVADALAQGADTLITTGGVQSNHCRATAVVAARLGLASHLVLRGQQPEQATGNLMLDELLGAELTYITNQQYQDSIEDIFSFIAQRYIAQGRKPYCIPTGASNGVGTWGYIAACKELKADFESAEIEPRHIVCATGSGGTQAGLSAGSYLYDLGARVWGINVCDDADYFAKKTRQDIQQWSERYYPQLDCAEVDINTIDGYVGPGYGRATAEIFDTIKSVAKLEGLILDPVYTGKAFHGFIQEHQSGRFGNDGDVVFIHTGGLFGLFAQTGMLTA